MKKALKLELFNDDKRQEFKLYNWKVSQALGEKGSKKFFGKSLYPKPYVAEIVGLISGEYQRKFLSHHRDYSQANSKGSRGIFLIFLLEINRVYEIKEQISWKNWNKYFCIVNQRGKLIQLKENSVKRYIEKCLKKY